MVKIQLPVRADFTGGNIILKATSNGDMELVKKFFAVKAQREKYNKKEFFVQAELDLPHQVRTFKQNRAVWKLITVIFESLEGRKPSEDEKNELYLDLLEVYADKTTNRLNGTTRPIHVSESNAAETARFIDGLIYHLAWECDLDYEAQTTVRSILFQWEAWKGTLNSDPADYQDEDCEELLNDAQWRRKYVYSQVSGRCGDIVKAHIVSRGSSAQAIDCSWNWIAMTQEEHQFQHGKGWEEFLNKYPHLRGRVLRAREMAKKLERLCDES